MNIKRFLGAAAALFVFMFFYEWIVNSYFLMDLYEKTSEVWRSFEEMSANMPIRIVSLLVVAVWIVLFWTRFYKTGGLAEGLLFGLFIGVLTGIINAGSYVWLPIPADLAWGWFGSAVVEGIGSGIILGAIYRE